MRPINLLTEEFLVAQTLRVHLRNWAIALVAIVALATLHGLQAVRAAQAARDEVAALDERCRPLRRLQTQIRQTKAALSTRQVSDAPLMHLGKDLPIETLLATVSNCVEETSGTVYLQRLSFAGAYSSGNKQRAVQLDGIGLTHTHISQLTDALRKSDVFSRVELTSSNEFAHNRQQLKTYAIECRYENATN